VVEFFGPILGALIAICVAAELIGGL